MLLVYVALIGSAGWLLATTPQGYIPAQDRGYVIMSAQLPGAASLARTTEIVRRIESIALDTPGIVRVAAFAGLSGATRTQASNSAALFPVFEEPEVRLKKGLTARGHHGRFAQAVVGDPGCLHHRDPAAADSRYRHRRWLHHAHPGPAGPRPRVAGRRDQRTRQCGAQDAGDLTSVFSPFSANTPQVFVDIDRVKAQKLGVPSRTSPTRSKPISVRPMSTTSTCSAAPIMSLPRPTCRSGKSAPTLRGCIPATPMATW